MCDILGSTEFVLIFGNLFLKFNLENFEFSATWFLLLEVMRELRHARTPTLKVMITGLLLGLKPMNDCLSNLFKPVTLATRYHLVNNGHTFSFLP